MKFSAKIKSILTMNKYNFLVLLLFITIKLNGQNGPTQFIYEDIPNFLKAYQC